MATPLLKSSIWAGLCGCALHCSVGVGAFKVMYKARRQAHRRQRGKVLAKGRLLNGKMGKKVEVGDASEENCEWRKTVYAAKCCSCREDADKKDKDCNGSYDTSAACVQMLQEAENQKRCPWASEGLSAARAICKKMMPTTATATTTKFYSCGRRKEIFIQKCCHCTEESAGKGQCRGETRKMHTCDTDLTIAEFDMKCDWAKHNIRVDHCKELAPIGGRPTPSLDCPSC
mmetsp:Transcript_1854/g.4277  ORF Transcript_1854/g.4277 Transcript_1854/m.4277 type:complete len:230 (+) Transcript_1854:94-783(+)|eukprot:g10854.t1